MPSYAIDSSKQGLIQTGVREAVPEWEDRDGKRRPTDRQAHDEATGMPLWGVEVLYQQSTFGRVSTVTAKVTVGALDEPVGQALTPIEFTGLTVDVRVIRESGALVESWRAEAVASGASPARGSRSGRSEGDQVAA